VNKDPCSSVIDDRLTERTKGPEWRDLASGSGLALASPHSPGLFRLPVHLILGSTLERILVLPISRLPDLPILLFRTCNLIAK